TQSTAIPNEPIPQGTGSCGSPRCQDTILGERTAQTRFERLSKQSHKPPLSRVNTPRRGEDNMQLMELMELCTKLSARVLALENNKTAQDSEITHLKKRVKRLKKNRKSRTLQLKRSVNITTAEPVTTVSAPITTAGVSISSAEPSIPPTTTTTVIKDEDLTIAQTLMKIRSEKIKEKAKERGSKKSSETATRPTRGVIMREVSKTTTKPTVPPQQKLDPKDKVVRLQAELDEEERQRIARVHESTSSFNVKEREDIEARVEADEEERSILLHKMLKQRGTSHQHRLNRGPICLIISRAWKSEVDRAVPELAAISSKRDAEEELDQGGSKREGNRHLHADREGVSIVKGNSYIDAGRKALGG
nr:hypothetical protein [Tanacetum cinerariifolium]